MDIVSLFCEIDDFYKIFEVVWRKNQIGNGRMRNRKSFLSVSEMMAILVMYHESGYKNLKLLYLREIRVHHRKEFPRMVSYKNISNIELSRHRSLWNFLGNLASGLIAYCWKEKKLSLNLNFKDLIPFTA